MLQFKDHVWEILRNAHGSHVIWTARIQAAAGFFGTIAVVFIDVLHNNVGLLSAFTSNQALIAELQIGMGVAYEMLRRYKAEDDF